MEQALGHQWILSEFINKYMRPFIGNTIRKYRFFFDTNWIHFNNRRLFFVNLVGVGKVIFVINAIMSSLWNVFIKFRWRDEKLTTVQDIKTNLLVCFLGESEALQLCFEIHFVLGKKEEILVKLKILTEC